MDIEKEIKSLKCEVFWTKMMLLFALLCLALTAFHDVIIDNKLIAKTSDIANKVDVVCEVKTNNVFGVFTKMKLIK